VAGHARCSEGGGTLTAEITVVTWNILGARQDDPAAVGTALRDFGADVALLQEVQRRHVNPIRRSSGLEHARWSLKHWAFPQRAEGLALLTRGRLHHLTKQRLSPGVWCWSWRRRVAQHATIDLDDASLAIVNVHLASGNASDERVAQAQRLLRRRIEGAPVAGDLNDLPGSPTLETFAGAGLRDAWQTAHPGEPDPPTNWRAGARDVPPAKRLDYLLVPESTQVVDAHVPTDWQRYAPLSDHLPLVARLRL
jgi:endonuclease/exonuclease/phosphatase family metal-dependent hydrolase